MVSVRGSKNFINNDNSEGKNILSGVTTKVDVRNQVPNI
jgi:hypothetical protein